MGTLGAAGTEEFQAPPPWWAEVQEAAPRTVAGGGRPERLEPTPGLGWGLSLEPGREEVKREGIIAQMCWTLSAAQHCLQ